MRDQAADEAGDAEAQAGGQEGEEGEAMTEAERLAGRGLEAAAVYLEGRLKEILNVAAPRKTVIAGPRSRRVPPGTRYYVATTPATPGAPPRKVSGFLQSHVTRRKVDDHTWQVGVWGVPYARRLEYEMDHKYLDPLVEAEAENVCRIIGEEIVLRFGGI